MADDGEVQRFSARDVTAVTDTAVYGVGGPNDAKPSHIMVRFDGVTFVGEHVQRSYVMDLEDLAALVAQLVEAGVRVNSATFKGLMVKWADECDGGAA